MWSDINNDDFSSNAVTLAYDGNGNLRDDGVYGYFYDAWNRLKQVYRSGVTDALVATYAYDGVNRRVSKTVTNSGDEISPSDGGNVTTHFYYSPQWQVLETRNGAAALSRQWVYGTQYVDEIVLMDINGDPSRNNDADPDTTAASGETGPTESPADARYFYHQDRNWNVVALSHYGGGKNAEIVERYTYTPYGEFSVQTAGGTESGRLLPCSSVGNPFAHQGLPFDAEKSSYQNRNREYSAGLQQALTRDPIDSESAYALHTNPELLTDPSGLDPWGIGLRRFIGQHRGIPTSGPAATRPTSGPASGPSTRPARPANSRPTSIPNSGPTVTSGPPIIGEWPTSCATPECPGSYRPDLTPAQQRCCTEQRSMARTPPCSRTITSSRQGQPYSRDCMKDGRLGHQLCTDTMITYNESCPAGGYMVTYIPSGAADCDGIDCSAIPPGVNIEPASEKFDQEDRIPHCEDCKPGRPTPVPIG